MNIANPNLIPESVNGLELGWDFKTEKSKTSLTYFSDQISNMIATSSFTNANEPAQVASLCGTLSSTSCGPSVNYYTNNQNGQSNGIELTHKWMYSDRLTFDGFVTYTNTYLTSAWNGVTTPLNTQLAGIPHITASLSATWKMDAKTQLFVQSYYIGPLNDSSSLSSSTVGNIQGGNNIINGSVIYAMDKSTDVYLNATNLFNLAYQDSTYSSLSAQTLAPPRTLNVGLRYRF